jgi:hypothetical protein
MNGMTAVVNMHEHMGHEMSHDKPMHHQAQEMSDSHQKMPCCDDCECNYSNCHNPLMLSFIPLPLEYNGSRQLKPFDQYIHHKHLPSHPYRPPIG